MSGTAVSFVVAVALFALYPATLLRDEPLRRYTRIDLSSSIVALLLFFNSAHLGIQEPAWWLAIFVVGKVTLLSIFLRQIPAGARAASPRMLAVFAGLLFLSLLPHVLQSPLDGDETHYTLLTDSLLHDHDLDLRNQYARSVGLVGRPIEAQFGDPVGTNGELYSRHEPLLSFLLIPGYAAFGTAGAVATLAIFGGLLVFSLLSLVSEEFPGFHSAVLFPFLVGPPVLFYATRIWPEVPAAFCFSQALRHRHLRSPARFGLYLVLLSTLKLRFSLIAIPLLVIMVARSGRRDWKRLAIVGAVLAIPFAALMLFDPGVFSVRPIDAVGASGLADAWRGATGLLFDAQAGLLFQAPLFFAGLLLACSRRTSAALSVGAAASVLYLLFLIPRPEWHGGWSPPLRYIVVFMPILAIAGAALLHRLRFPALTLFALATGGLAIHGIAQPPHLFHIANGESELGEVLSARTHTDFSRLFPSLIRPNTAALIYLALAGIAVVILIVARRFQAVSKGGGGILPPLQNMKTQDFQSAREQGVSNFSLSLIPAVLSLLVYGVYTVGMSPGSVVNLEDTHVQHAGGRLYPELFTVARFRYQGGWTFAPGDQSTFQARSGEAHLAYFADAGAVITLDGVTIRLPAAPHDRWRSVLIVLSDKTPHILRCVEGEVTIDRITHG